MTDTATRILSRGTDLHSQALLLNIRRRAGEFSEDRLKLAAFCGNPAARLLLDQPEEQEQDSGRFGWLDHIRQDEALPIRHEALMVLAEHIYDHVEICSCMGGCEVCATIREALDHGKLFRAGKPNHLERKWKKVSDLWGDAGDHRFWVPNVLDYSNNWSTSGITFDAMFELVPFADAMRVLSTL